MFWQTVAGAMVPVLFVWGVLTVLDVRKERRRDRAFEKVEARIIRRREEMGRYLVVHPETGGRHRAVRP